ncbi:Glycosyltransferase, GT2 family [Pseudooceanicola antarcticus]|uniref:Glycosyltransferase family 2 protein n=1 Tax=Pseudooceanicola antarcticus TaxID=1247613 RepID=A0A285J3P4_9RHOB|nr:glycosyltransferase [Pseudooceanicola antarcticus]PJE29659.1 glycosyltransferase family 2 protein [Pseudooceanicola antarcticus]SNY54939.1 Glycosyltransferase, GT2 family [Pseudooceanicola antarcticus]
MNVPGIFPNEPTYRLQELLFPASDRPEDLYLRADPPPRQAGGILYCAAGTRLDFGTWFNALYLGFWLPHSRVADLALRLALNGRARVLVELRRADRPPRLLTLQELEGAGETFVLPLKETGETGHLALVVECLSPCQILHGAFVTGTDPDPVRLSIGICTFNREPQLCRTLQALASIRRSLPELADVIVVNQGAALSGEATQRALESLGARLIDQPNLGGAGGFTRGLAEAATSAAEPSHHLLMDDDILLDPRMIRRLCDALAYTGDSAALGGAMLETERPRVLHEAGARVRPGWHVNSYGMGRSLVRPQTLGLFDRVEPAHYNGWWYCAVPLAALRRAGLPLPLFIRGDDIEFGCRLGAQGVESLPLPGCGVWHDAFAAKAQPWLTYYDYRNLLINAALYPQLARPPRPVDVLGALIARLICHQYRMARAVEAAAEDYLAGPDAVLARPPAELHREVLDRFAREDGIQGRAAPPGPRPMTPMPAGLWRRVAYFIYRLVQITLVARKDPPAHSLSLYEINPASVPPGAYLRRRDMEGQDCLELSPDRLRLWRGVARALWLWLRFLCLHRRAARRWQAEAMRHASRRAWDERFAQ